MLKESSNITVRYPTRQWIAGGQDGSDRFRLTGRRVILSSINDVT